MIDQEKLDTILQVIGSLEHGVLKLEKAFEKKDSEEFESAKRIILELQRKLSEELK